MKTLLKRLVNWSSIIWAVYVAGTLGVIAIATKFGTYDPNFTSVSSLPKGQEARIGMVMLSFFFVGLAAFVIMILSWILSLVSKSQEFPKPLLGIKTRYSVIAVGSMLLAAVIFLIGIARGSQSLQKSGNYSGQELFDKVNEYRAGKSLKAVELNWYICDNLVKRWLAIKESNAGHKGFEEWVVTEGLDKRFAPIVELYITDTNSSDQAINFWASSPGHRLSLEADLSVGCAYASQGVGVIILGNLN